MWTKGRWPLKLSEAIRLGAMMKPHIRGRLYDGVGTCALGAALDAIAANPDDGAAYMLSSFPLLGRAAVHPITGDRWVSLYGAIADLNDCHGWTRECIADWVEQIELQQAAETNQPATSEAQRAAR